MVCVQTQYCSTGGIILSIVALYLGAITTTQYQYGSGVIHFGYFGCVGDEINILSCPHSLPSYCSHSTDAGVICRGNGFIA